MPVSQELDLTQLVQALESQGRDLSQVDLRPCWQRVTMLLKAKTTDFFHEGKAPDGTYWAPLRKPSKKRGGKSAKPLRDTDKLMLSILGTGGNHIERTEPTSLVWGTNIDYGPYHQYGTRTIPRRQFLGMDDEMQEAIGEVVLDYLGNQFLSRPVR